MPRALHNMTLPQSPANACTLCSELPAELWVNTGRDEAFPDVVRRLLRLGLSDDDDVWQCPQCNEAIEGQFTACWHCGAQRLGAPL